MYTQVMDPVRVTEDLRIWNKFESKSKIKQICHKKCSLLYQIFQKHTV